MKDREEIRKLYLSIEEEFNCELILLDSYKEIMSRVNKVEELLETCLNKNDYKIFENYMEIENEMTALIMEESFVKGFSVAYKLLIGSLR